jgi:hypothetical protein
MILEILAILAILADLVVVVYPNKYQIQIYTDLLVKQFY